MRQDLRANKLRVKLGRSWGRIIVVTTYNLRFFNWNLNNLFDFGIDQVFIQAHTEAPVELIYNNIVSKSVFFSYLH